MDGEEPENIGAVEGIGALLMKSLRHSETSEQGRHKLVITGFEVDGIAELKYDRIDLVANLRRQVEEVD